MSRWVVVGRRVGRLAVVWIGGWAGDWPSTLVILMNRSLLIVQWLPSGSFTDVDECEVTGMCPNGHCVNQMGGYRCRCDKDFALNAKGTGCVGKFNCG